MERFAGVTAMGLQYAAEDGDACFTGECGESFIMGSHECRLLQKVLGGVAAQGKFREYSQFTSLCICLLQPGQHLVGIVRKITDNGIDLDEGNFHAVYIASIYCCGMIFLPFRGISGYI